MSGDILEFGNSNRTISEAEKAELFDALGRAGLWGLRQSNARDGELLVKSLLTKLEVREGGKVYSRHWAGMDKARLRVVDALFQSPIGKEATQGMKKVCHFDGKVPRLPLDASQLQIQLENVPAARMIPILQYLHPYLSLTPHPSYNGFFPKGARADILKMMSEVRDLDHLPFLQ